MRKSRRKTARKSMKKRGRSTVRRNYKGLRHNYKGGVTPLRTSRKSASKKYRPDSGSFGIGSTEKNEMRMRNMNTAERRADRLKRALEININLEGLELKRQEEIAGKEQLEFAEMEKKKGKRK